MHIGFLTPEYIIPGHTSGGLGSYIHKTALALVARGETVTVFVASWRNAQWQDNGVTVHEVRSVVWPYRTRHIHATVAAVFSPMVAQLLSARRLANQVWRVHANTPIHLLQTSDFRAPGYALRHNKQIPLVCRISSYTPLWRSANGKQRALGDLLTDWLEIRQVVDAEDAFAPSQLLVDTWTRFEGCRPKLIRTPIEDPNLDFADESYYRTHFQNYPYLLYFGSLSRIKGVDLLADALLPVLASHKNIAAGFVGSDSRLPSGQNVRDHLLERCQPFAHQLAFHAWLPKAQLYPVIANALGVLMPSRVDNYPNACLEAQMLGVPVIGTYGSSLDEMIEDGQTGFLAKMEDATDISHAIQRLLALTPSERRGMQARIHAAVHKIRYEDRIGQLLDYYDNVIHRFGAISSPRFRPSAQCVGIPR